MVGVLFVDANGGAPPAPIIISSCGSSVTIGRGGPTPELKRLLRSIQTIPRAACTASQNGDRLSVLCLRGCVVASRCSAVLGGNMVNNSGPHSSRRKPTETFELLPGTSLLLTPNDSFELTRGSGVVATYRLFSHTSFQPEWLTMTSQQLLSELCAVTAQRCMSSSPQPQKQQQQSNTAQNGVASSPQHVPSIAPTAGGVAATLSSSLEEESYSGSDFADAVHKLEAALKYRSGGPVLSSVGAGGTSAVPSSSLSPGNKRMREGDEVVEKQLIPRSVRPAAQPGRQVPLELLESQVVVFEHE